MEAGVGAVGPFRIWGASLLFLPTALFTDRRRAQLFDAIPGRSWGYGLAGVEPERLVHVQGCGELCRQGAPFVRGDLVHA